MMYCWQHTGHITPHTVKRARLYRSDTVDANMRHALIGLGRDHISYFF